jgi:hypothetical protein
VVSCSFVGEAYERTDCADDAAPRICVEGGGQRAAAFCAETSAPDPRCNVEDATDAYCVGEELTECRQGFVARTTACVACITTNGFDGFCSLSAERDPRCENDFTLERSFCDANWVVKCTDGYTRPFIDCKDEVCQESVDHGQCF